MVSYLKLDDNVLDIGCDHGYYLIEAHKLGIKNIMGSDINAGPLLCAKKNLISEGLADTIPLIQSNGLEKITGYFDTLNICGMGGKLIAEILERGNKLSKLENCQKIIIQPMNCYEILRRKIYELGYIITKEELIKDDRIYLYFLCQKKSNLSRRQVQEHLYESDLDFLIGKGLLQQKDVNFQRYLSAITLDLNNRLKGLILKESKLSIEDRKPNRNFKGSKEELMDLLERINDYVN